MADPVKYTWHEGERRYRDDKGRFVSRVNVRLSLDRYLDNLSDEVGRLTERLVDGEIEISAWQTRMEAAIKRGHVTATAIAKGGHKQAKSRDWGRAGKSLAFEYDRLRRFARQLEDGRPLNGGTVARAKMYALAPTKTYEAVLRADDKRAGFDRERRLLHSQESCKQCIRYARKGWQPVGKLPGIGEKSDCLSRCRCTFERERSPLSRRERLWALISMRRSAIRDGGLPRPEMRLRPRRFAFWPRRRTAG